MDLLPWAVSIRHLHVSLVATSVLLFCARGLSLLTAPQRAQWAMSPLARRASVLIDTLLLGTGATLWALFGLHPVHQPWLGTKLVLLLVYIVLGSFALKRARSSAARWAFFIGALCCVGFMASVALARHPLGLFAAS